MELKKYDTLSAVEQPHEFIITDWDDQPTDAAVTVIGIGSKTYEKYYQKIDRATQAVARRNKTLEQDESNELYVELLAQCTKGWKGIEEDGKPVEFNLENARRVYMEYPYIRNFVLKCVMDVREFVGN